MRKRKMKKNRILKGITFYMGILFYFSAGALADTQSKFALVMCLISVTWLVSILGGSHVFDEENSEKKAVSGNVLDR